jgi:hypothetical protein
MIAIKTKNDKNARSVYPVRVLRQGYWTNDFGIMPFCPCCNAMIGYEDGKTLAYGKYYNDFIKVSKERAAWCPLVDTEEKSTRSDKT